VRAVDNVQEQVVALRQVLEDAKQNHKLIVKKNKSRTAGGGNGEIPSHTLLIDAENMQ
jgi:hypothetical protein